MIKRWFHRKQDSLESKASISRRQFLKAGLLTGSAAMLGSCSYRQMEEAWQVPGDYPFAEPENILYSVCLQCNTGCGIKVKLHEGTAVKIDGNPRAPQTLWPHLPYESSPFMTAAIDGALCPKGQAGLQTVYDPYRLRTVLKRAGKRGENQWITIPFEQAIQEIAEDGTLFKNVPGEENRQVPGLKELWALRDPQSSKRWRTTSPRSKRSLKRCAKESSLRVGSKTPSAPSGKSIMPI